VAKENKKEYRRWPQAEKGAAWADLDSPLPPLKKVLWRAWDVGATVTSSKGPTSRAEQAFTKTRGKLFWGRQSTLTP